MTKRMLIDATHTEETRVVVLDGTTLEDFDVETASRKQLKGNIYLAKVVRVEPSLQAAFVEYGGGRHGFLAFGEIHPDYYQIPIADRQRLLAMQAEEARAAEAEYAALDDVEDVRGTVPVASQTDQRDQPPAQGRAGDPVETVPDEAVTDEAVTDEAGPGESVPDEAGPDEAGPEPAEAPPEDSDPEPEERPWTPAQRTPAQPAAIPREERFGLMETVPEPDVPGGDLDAAEEVAASGEEAPDEVFEGAGAAEPPPPAEFSPPDFSPGEEGIGEPNGREHLHDVPTALPEPPPETLGGDAAGEEAEADREAVEARARRASRLLRTYRIQEVIHRRQVMLVQVVKEERGTKGAALTTYISLAGRYSVLMPNSPRGGGISRKITSAADRKRLREVTAELDLPPGMGLIVRTAGANRPKPEIRRDCEYLMRLWDDIRDLTMRSVAPALIYEEASLIKRAIRDVYSRDIEEIIVDGDDGWRAAHDFMRQLMPSHASKVRLWRGEGNGRGSQPLFSKYQVEAQLEAMLSPTVQLRSGGYLVIDQTEALVAIDVNSGRSTRERNVEETAVRTNLEAADEIGRQLRLRDLAGLIVIDFIDMESRKHVAAVERRMKDALRDDRARLQVGHISHFGLMEMSRQRLRPSLAETSLDVCPHCGGTGHVRSAESSAITALRAIEDEGAKAKASVVMVHASGAVVMFLLNQKRDRLAEIEARYAMRVQFAIDDTLAAGQTRIDRVRAKGAEDLRAMPAAPVVPVPPADAEEAEEAADIVEPEPEEDEDDRPALGGQAATQPAPQAGTQAGDEAEHRRRRRRRRRGGRREPDQPGGGDPAGTAAESDQPSAEDAPVQEVGALDAEQPSVPALELEDDGQPARSRRGRRGGRRRRPEGGAEPPAVADAPAPYSGPTPAEPFGGGYDIFDLLDTAADHAPPPERPAPEPAVVVVTESEQVVEFVADPHHEPAQAPAEPETVAVEVPSEPEPEPAPEPEPPAAESAPPGPQIGPPVQPILLGTEAAASDAPRRRGWWRP